MSLLDRLFGPRKYISVSYTEETQGNLRKWCLDKGIDLTRKYDGSIIKPEEFHFHTTLMLSISRHKHLLNRDIGVRACVEQIEMARFGKKKSGLGLRIKCRKLERMRRIFEVSHNVTDTWVTFDPHISLSYSHMGPVPDDIPDFPLVISSLKVEDVCPKTQIFSSFRVQSGTLPMGNALPS